MATIAFIIFLTLSTTIHARESQFFAKVSNNNLKETQPLNTNQQTPDFIPQTQDGVPYGHESGQLPPSSTTTTTTTNNNNNNNNNNNFNNNNNNNNDGYLPANLPENYNPVAYTTPIHSSTQDIPDEYRYEPQGYRYNGQSETYNSQNQNDENTYNFEKQGMSDTRFLENGKYYYDGNNGYNSQKQGFNDARFMETEDGGNTYNSRKQAENSRYNQGEEMYNSQKQGMGTYSTNNNLNMYNNEKQGMSDTRFLENGKYFYDLNMENANANTNTNSRWFNSRNGYNSQGYNTQGYYGNNENSYDRYNSNGGYENQEEFEQDQFNP